MPSPLAETAAPPAPGILLMGFPTAEASALVTLLAPWPCALAAPDSLLRHVEAGARLLVLGGALPSRQILELLLELLRRAPRADWTAVVLAAGPEPAIFQDLVNRDRVFYLSAQAPALDAVAQIVAGAWRQLQIPGPGDELERAAAGELATRGLELVRSLARVEDLGEALRRIARETCRELDASRCRCWIYDAQGQTLWTLADEEREERRESAASGLTSFVARTGAPLRLERLGEDPRYDPELDNDGGPAGEHFLALPLQAATGRGPAVAGVLVLLRAPEQEPFSAAEQDSLQFLADQAAPQLARLLLARQVESLARERHSVLRGETAAYFRSEAVEHYHRGTGEQGQVLEITPAWTRRAYPVLLALMVFALLFSIFFQVDEWAAGVGVVRSAGRVDVTAPAGGTVAAIEVEPGQVVAAGDLLVRLYGAQETAELRRVRREFQLGLLDRLRRPADRAAANALGELRVQQQLAEARLEQRSVRAPSAGAVGDVRVRAGQWLAPGEVILTLGGGDQGLRLWAVLPGQYRPLLRPGMILRLELNGYRFAYQRLEVEAVSAEVFGPSEARRLLGPGGSDALPIEGPVVLVEARLPGPTFESDGRTYAYHDGIVGRVFVRTRRERLIFSFIPALRWFFEREHG